MSPEPVATVAVRGRHLLGHGRPARGDQLLLRALPHLHRPLPGGDLCSRCGRDDRRPHGAADPGTACPAQPMRSAAPAGPHCSGVPTRPPPRSPSAPARWCHPRGCRPWRHGGRRRRATTSPGPTYPSAQRSSPGRDGSRGQRLERARGARHDRRRARAGVTAREVAVWRARTAGTAGRGKGGCRWSGWCPTWSCPLAFRSVFSHLYVERRLPISTGSARVVPDLFGTS